MIETLFGKTKRKILALFFLNSDRQYYFSEVVRAAGIRQGAVQRELKVLTASNILNAEKRGYQTFYSVNKNSPIYNELFSIMFKTYAVGEVLTGALKEFKDKIKAAFIYGSIAKGEDTVKSDIDLFVIGQVDFGDLSVTLAKPEEKLGRPVNIYSLTPDEFTLKVQDHNHFVTRVLKNEKIFLIGSEDDLGRMGKEQVAKKRANKRQGNRQPVRFGRSRS